MELGFRNLQVHCIIGCLEHERNSEQLIECDLCVEVETSAAEFSDNIQNTVSYAELADLFEGHAIEGKYQLLEKLAGDFRDLVKSSFPAVRAGSLEIRKPGAITAADAAFVRLKW